MREWFGEQWKQIRGHVKFEAVKIVVVFAITGGVSTVIALVLHWVQRVRHAPQQDVLGYVILGVLIFCALLLCVVLVLVLRVGATNQESAPKDDIPSQEQLKEIFPPRPVDLAAEIFTLFFRASDTWGSYEVFFNLRIVNRGQQKATVTDSRIVVIVGEEEPQHGTQIPIPGTFHIRAKADSIFDTTPVDTPLTPRISMDHVYETGVPHAGWMAFSVSGWGTTAFPYNARFLLKLTDSFGGEHWFERVPLFYRFQGEIIQVEPPSQIAAISSFVIPPPPK
jgi:hypothetical protein